jgi:hypothetical protein
VNVAAAGFPSLGYKAAREGSRVPRMATETAGAPGAVAASPKLTRRPTCAAILFPSTGVGAVQAAPGIADGLAPDQDAAVPKAGSARHTTAAPINETRRLGRMKRATLEHMPVDGGDLDPPVLQRIVTGVPTGISRSRRRMS